MRERGEMPGPGRWEFVGLPIDVAVHGELPEPVEFCLYGKTFHVEEILVSWFDWGFPAGAKQRDWRTRRHRRYYRLATSSGEVFEIYHDRRAANEAGDWICFQRWVAQ